METGKNHAMHFLNSGSKFFRKGYSIVFTTNLVINFRLKIFYFSVPKSIKKRSHIS